MIDYHIHIQGGAYTTEWIDAFWQAAQERGVAEIGIAEHAYQFIEFKPLYEDAARDCPHLQRLLQDRFQHTLADYFTLLRAARKQGIPLKMALEVDYVPGKADVVKGLLAGAPLDYVTGSLTVVGISDFQLSDSGRWQGTDRTALSQRYYQVLEEAAASELFDVLAYIDQIRVVGVTEPDEHVFELLKTMHQRKVCLELSTAGLRATTKELYPSEAILRNAAAAQVPIVIGSGAYSPAEVASDWERAAIVARRAGYREYRVFTERKSYAEKLPS